MKLGFIILILVGFGVFTIHEASAHHVLKEIPVGISPMKMSLDDDLLFVSNLGDRKITIIDTKSGQTLGDIDTSSGVVAVKAIPEKNLVYAATFESGGIDMYDLKTKKYLTTISLPDALITMWYSPRSERQEYLTLMTGGVALDYNPNNKVLYVANYNADYVATIDTNTNQVLEKIPVSAHPFAIKVDPVTNKILVASMAGNEITFLIPNPHDAKKHSISSTIKTGAAPWGIDIDGYSHRAYITHRGDHHITILDTISEKILDKIEVGDDTQAIAVDSVDDQIYVSYLQQNKIVKINARTNQIINTVDSDGLAWDLALDSKTHKLYASMKGENKIFVLGPMSYSIALPVVTIQTPIAYVGNILAHSQDVYVSEAALDIEKKALVLVTEVEDGGKLTVQIPRALLDAKKENGNDMIFMVYADNKLVDQETNPHADGSRYVSIELPKGTESVTISGTTAIPEFGPIAGVILATAIFGIMILARKQ